MPKRRGKKGSEAAQLATASQESKLLGGLPHVVEHMTARTYDDGESRTPGTVLLATQGSMWRAIAKEPDAGVQLVVYMPSADDCLVQLELLLGTDEAPWEPDPFARPKGSNKGKK